MKLGKDIYDNIMLITACIVWYSSLDVQADGAYANYML